MKHARAIPTHACDSLFARVHNMCIVYTHAYEYQGFSNRSPLSSENSSQLLQAIPPFFFFLFFFGFWLARFKLLSLRIKTFNSTDYLSIRIPRDTQFFIENSSVVRILSAGEKNLRNAVADRCSAFYTRFQVTLAQPVLLNDVFTSNVRACIYICVCVCVYMCCI